jgi:hypothetical protein
MRTRPYVLVFVALVLIYIGIVFSVPTDPAALERYGITDVQAKLINVTVVAPLVIIWLTALYGFVNLKKYADTVADTQEGPAFKYISAGLMILAFSLPLNAIIGSVTRYLSRSDPDLLIPLTIMRNHVTLIFSLAAFWVLVIGTQRLVKTLKLKKFSVTPKGFVTGLVVLAVIYTWMITSKPLNQGAEERAYYLPTWLLILALVIPYLLAWKAGVLAAYYLYTYHQKVKGVIFKSAFKDLARGIGVVVFVAILIQLITTSSAQLNRLNLTPILGIIYGLLILYAVGYGLVARGAKKLKKFEDL